METISRRRSWMESFRKLLSIVCISLLAGGEGAIFAQEAPQATPPAAPAKSTAEKRSPDQLDSLVAPIALYPDPLLAQTLVASTYPLEVVQLQQWLAKNSTLKDKALADAVAKQPWDPSIQSMAAVPEVVKRLADDVQWTAQLGDAFLDQQSEVMDAVQRMRKKAQDKGTLTSTEQMKVETKVVESKTVIVLEQTNPEVVYVPSYSPTVVYGPAYYPYPPIYYPPYYGGAWIGFGVGMFWGAAIWGGSCCGCGWGGGDININNNNNFNRNSNRNQVNPQGGDRGGNRGGDRGGNRGGSRNQVNPQGGAGNRGGGNGKWSHNPQHRGGAPYSNRETANKFGGSTRGDSRTSRGSAGVSNRASGGAASRGGSAGVSNRASGSAGSRGGSGGGSFSGGGGDRIGNQSIGGSRSGSSAFGGSGSRGYSGGSARSSSSRGSSSMGSRGGGGGRGGGGRGGRR
jgi:uncharacterized protein DUF3300